MIVLASTSASRRAMLAAAGVSHEATPPNVDEEAAKASLAGLPPRDLADALAELKALKVSQLRPGDLVLGCDSVVALADGRLLDKPASRAEAAEHLASMSGAVHDLWSSCVLAEGGAAAWRHVERARMHVRPLSDGFIEHYLDAAWPAVAGSVGCYHVEGLGAQLFDRIDGSHFTVMGLPLLALLAQLRVRGALTS